MKPKLRVSYSLLLCWASGRHEDAVNMYLHRQSKRSLAMEEGIEFHKEWAKTIERDKRLTIGATTLNFALPKCEQKYIAPYNELFDLSGTFDCLDDKTLYEFKSGGMLSTEYSNGYQLGMYFLIAELLKIPIDMGIILHYNQKTKREDSTSVWNYPGEIDKARNAVDSIAPEIYDYFLENKIPFDKKKNL